MTGESNVPVLGERIRKARESLGLSRTRLGQQSGLSEDSIVRYEEGPREPKASHLAAIARALNTTPDELLGFESDEGSAA